MDTLHALGKPGNNDDHSATADSGTRGASQYDSTTARSQHHNKAIVRIAITTPVNIANAAASFPPVAMDTSNMRSSTTAPRQRDGNSARTGVLLANVLGEKEARGGAQ